MAVDHYENFPVASIALPARFRRPVGLIYRFAREADDIADEGNASPDERLRGLRRYHEALDDLEAGRPPAVAWFDQLGVIVSEYGLPFSLFHDLLSAFEQDVTRTRYDRLEEVLDYCRRSANPVGRLLLVLYGTDSPVHRAYSDSICTALQLINFLQDVRIDYAKGRIYLPLDELQAAGIAPADIGRAPADDRWRAFMRQQCGRARSMLLSGSPLGRAMRGRLGFEMRMIVAGGSRILDKIDAVHGDVFRHRPVLRWHDWPLLVLGALAS